MLSDGNGCAGTGTGDCGVTGDSMFMFWRLADNNEDDDGEGESSRVVIVTPKKKLLRLRLIGRHSSRPISILY